MRSTEIAPEAVVNLVAAFDPETPVYMMNLVRYRDEAAYPAGAEYPPCSGREAFFTRYVPATAQAMEKVAPGTSTMFFYAQVHALLCAPTDEVWHNVAIAKYQSVEALRILLESDEYKTLAEPHRLAALEDWRFIAVTPVTPGA